MSDRTKHWALPAFFLCVAMTGVGIGVWQSVWASAAPSGPSDPGSEAGEADRKDAAASEKQAEEIRWRTDLDAALKDARKTGKQVVVDFWATWCGPCKKMNRTTFEDDRVKRRLKNFIAVKIDVDKQKQVAQRYGIRGLPTNAVLRPSGRPVTGRVGYLGPDAYLKMLDRAAKQAGAGEAGSKGRAAPSWGVDQWINLPEDRDELDVDDFEGKVVYILGFQTWCPGCHKVGFPNLKKTMQRYKGNDDVRFVAIQTAFEGYGTNDFEGAKETAERYNLQIPVAHSGGPDGRSAFMKRYRTRGTPWVVVIDQQGRIRYSDFHLPPDQAGNLIDRLLNESKKDEPENTDDGKTD